MNMFWEAVMVIALTGAGLGLIVATVIFWFNRRKGICPGVKIILALCPWWRACYLRGDCDADNRRK